MCMIPEEIHCNDKPSEIQMRRIISLCIFNYKGRRSANKSIQLRLNYEADMGLYVYGEKNQMEKQLFKCNVLVSLLNSLV